MGVLDFFSRVHRHSVLPVSDFRHPHEPFLRPFASLPETFAPYLLTLKARKLRRETGDERYHSPLEKASHTGLKRLAYDLLLSPFVMLIQEPMLLLTSLFMSYVYGILYLMFSALPFIFVDQHHWNVGVAVLSFSGRA